MPILKIRIVQTTTDLSSGLAQSIADATGAVFESKPNGTWVTIETIPASLYAENGGAAECPVFVDVTLGQWQDTEKMKRLAQELAAVVANVVARPIENVHILFAPPAKGRIAFGGIL